MVAFISTPDSLPADLWPMADHLNTVRDILQFREVWVLPENSSEYVTEIQKVMVEHTAYDSFGRVAERWTRPDELTAWTKTYAGNLADSATPIGYTGKYFEATVGMQRNGFRWYDAEIGKWISEDPIGFAAGDSNLTRYVGNQATVGLDPNGLCVCNDDEFERPRVQEQDIMTSVLDYDYLDNKNTTEIIPNQKNTMLIRFKRPVNYDGDPRNGVLLIVEVVRAKITYCLPKNANQEYRLISYELPKDRTDVKYILTSLPRPKDIPVVQFVKSREPDGKVVLGEQYDVSAAIKHQLNTPSWIGVKDDNGRLSNLLKAADKTVNFRE